MVMLSVVVILCCLFVNHEIQTSADRQLFIFLQGKVTQPKGLAGYRKTKTLLTEKCTYLSYISVEKQGVGIQFQIPLHQNQGYFIYLLQSFTIMWDLLKMFL